MGHTKNIDRDEIVNKISIVNKIIRKGYETVIGNIENTHRDYCLSIKDHNFFQLREQLMLELTPLVFNHL